MTKHTRRSLLEIGWRSMGVAAALGLGGVSGQTNGTGRRVLVSVMLLGGNDSNNLVVPLDGRGYNAYAAARGELALPAASLVPLHSARLRARIGVAPEAADLARLYEQGVLAVIANVGDLECPLTRAAVLADRESLPGDAFSHAASSKMQFLAGGFAVPRWFSAFLKQDSQEFENRTFRFRSGVTAASSAGAWITGGRLDNPTLMAAADAVAVSTPFPQSGIGQELLQAVKLAQAGANLGLQNQLITCVMNGWDTHRQELERNVVLYAELSQALSAFYGATVELGISRDVTAFTWSEFGRAAAPNKTHGSEHGWGGNHVVLGAAVRGGEVYGRFPSMELAGSDDAVGNGSWIPSTSTVQFAATLARWFGMSTGEIRSVFPDLNNFATEDMGFL